MREVFRRFHEAEPEPKGELEHVNAYTLLVAVVLSAQATDAGVNSATRALFAIADTPQKMLDLGEDKVREAIKTIGLFRTKAKNVDRTLAQARRGAWRRGAAGARDRWRRCPASAARRPTSCSTWPSAQPTIAVDTHMFRVSNRMPLAPGEDAAGSGARAGEDRAAGLRAARASLAHPARALCLQGAKARMPPLPRSPISAASSRRRPRRSSRPRRRFSIRRRNSV